MGMNKPLSECAENGHLLGVFDLFALDDDPEQVCRICQHLVECSQLCRTGVVDGFEVDCEGPQGGDAREQLGKRAIGGGLK